VDIFEAGEIWLALVEGSPTQEGKKGDPYIRRLLVIGAHAVLRFARNGKASTTKWAAVLLARKPYKVAAVALANKMARIVWALLTKNEEFKLQLAS
jgi:transposase